MRQARQKVGNFEAEKSGRGQTVTGLKRSQQGVWTSFHSYWRDVSHGMMASNGSTWKMTLTQQ